MHEVVSVHVPGPVPHPEALPVECVLGVVVGRADPLIDHYRAGLSTGVMDPVLDVRVENRVRDPRYKDLLVSPKGSIGSIPLHVTGGILVRVDSIIWRIWAVALARVKGPTLLVLAVHEGVFVDVLRVVDAVPVVEGVDAGLAVEVVVAGLAVERVVAVGAG